jgi:hypothetical protein
VHYGLKKGSLRGSGPVLKRAVCADPDGDWVLLMLDLKPIESPLHALPNSPPLHTSSMKPAYNCARIKLWRGGAHLHSLRQRLGMTMRTMQSSTHAEPQQSATSKINNISNINKTLYARNTDQKRLPLNRAPGQNCLAGPVAVGIQTMGTHSPRRIIHILGGRHRFLLGSRRQVHQGPEHAAAARALQQRILEDPCIRKHVKHAAGEAEHKYGGG